MTDQKKRQLEDWLDDLCVRFIINLPEDDLSSVPRICFQVEEAQWFYEDFVRPLDPTLPSMNLRNFCLRIFAHCPLLSAFSQGDHMRAFDEFLMYKTRVPVRGVIMLNHAMDHVVLVKGWKKNANWSFPRGKINKDEDDLICAMRESYEETGYDIEAAGLVPEDRDVKFIEINIRDQQMRLYVFRDVPMDTHFEPRTRKEISKIDWWKLSDLPTFRKKNQQQQLPEAAVSANKFYMVAPFLIPLKKWVMAQKKKDEKYVRGSKATSAQYAAAAMSHDEAVVEEDHNELHEIEPMTSVPDLDTLQEATAALTRLLKIQPATQGLQPDAISAVGSPVTKDTGNALLALLQSRPQASNQPSLPNPPPQTPLDHPIQTYMPGTPQHGHPRPPHHTNAAPPPTYPIKQSRDTSNQEPEMLYSNNNNNRHQTVLAAQQHIQRMQGRREQPQKPQGPHPYQPQHLIHPQPLPPHVQKAVFTGGPVLTPVVPSTFQQQAPSSFNSPVPVSTANSQFSNVHAPMVAPQARYPPPPLTSHSLALLNAFKGHDKTPAETTTTDLPLRKFTQQQPVLPPPPQELSGETSRNASAFAPRQEPQQTSSSHSNPNASLRAPISAAHRSSLLGMFKSPNTVAASLGQPASASALPTSVSPTAVELSAVSLEHISPPPVPSPPIISNRKGREPQTQNGISPRSKAATNLPFQASSILARPNTGDRKPGGPSQSTHAPSHRIHSKDLPASEMRSKALPERPFQPQILRRPQPGSSTAQARPDTAPVQAPQITKPVHTQAAQPAEHKQALLSLFGNASSATTMPTPKLSRDGGYPLPPPEQRSRVGSLASGAGDGSRRGSQAQPISPADKGFLLGYLGAVANRGF